MPLDLVNTWTIGKDRIMHAGFAVFTLRGRLNDIPADLVAQFDSAEKAVASAERLGANHAAFRVTSGGTRGMQPRERLSRSDLPVNIVPTLSRAC